MRTKGRDEQPFEIRLESGATVEARAVIDATGTWTRPNPAASGGVPVPGERELSDRIAYGIPDVLGRERSVYAGKRVLVVGSGHSAFNVVLDLLTLMAGAPGTDHHRGSCDATTLIRSGVADPRTPSKRAARSDNARGARLRPDSSAC